MPHFQTGVVVRLLESRDGLVRCLVDLDGSERRATAFTQMTGTIDVGDKVVVNTIAVDLELGSGGEDFVLWNLRNTEAGSPSGGHILKLRYTPWQLDAVTAEAPESPYHDLLADSSSIENMPVVVCSLHSQIAPALAMIRSLGGSTRLAYLMTDGASLPLVHSDLVAELKEKQLIDTTLSIGHAFGGELECVNIFSGLIAARKVARADVTIVSPGPGIVGTDTPFGHTGMEQGQILSAAAALGGRPVAALRVSFADSRPRHRGVSHHSLSALRIAANMPSTVAVPKLSGDKTQLILDALEGAGISDRHEVRVVDAASVKDVLDKFDLAPKTMGRSVDEDREFFEAAGAAGIVAYEMLAVQ